jgi:chromosome segregation ATPase
MEGIIIAITGTIAAVGSIYAARVEYNKRKLDSKDTIQKNKLDEFGALLQGYKDLKNEYEEQVKELRKENGKLHAEILSMRRTMRDYEQRLQKFEKNQEVIK